VDQSCEEATEDRKRKYNSLKAEVDVTEEEMEAYRLRKDRGADPMAKLASSDEILDYK
jgi:pre-mRNA-processing factor SLU7